MPGARNPGPSLPVAPSVLSSTMSSSCSGCSQSSVLRLIVFVQWLPWAAAGLTFAEAIVVQHIRVGWTFLRCAVAIFVPSIGWILPVRSEAETAELVVPLEMLV